MTTSLELLAQNSIWIPSEKALGAMASPSILAAHFGARNTLVTCILQVSSDSISETFELQVYTGSCYHLEVKSHVKAGRLATLERSTCPIANTLELVGDKWTLLVVRDLMFFGKRLYGELLQLPEGIPSNILADRLKRLEETGLISKKPYQKNPVRYEYRLTPVGIDLFPVLREMIKWGNRHIPGTIALPPGLVRKPKP